VGGMASSYSDEVRISEHSVDCRVLTDAKPPYRIVHVNDAWCQVTGYSAKALIGKTCQVLQGPETCKETTKVRSSMLEADSGPLPPNAPFCAPRRAVLVTSLLLQA
jgi:hypothetical protein